MSAQIFQSCLVHPVFDHKVDIVMKPHPHGNLSVNFDVEVTYFLHIHLLGNPPDFRDLIYILCNC